ncbi:MAG: hypothetical protein Q9195_006317 [Heterodermia aff. obscurata]
MPTLRPTLLNIYRPTLKSQHGSRKRGFSILKDFGIENDTQRIEAYEKRHQRFIKALRGDLKSKAKETLISRETAGIDSAERQVKLTAGGKVDHKYVINPLIRKIKSSFDSKVPIPLAQDQILGAAPQSQDFKGRPLQTENIRGFRQHSQRQIKYTVSSVLPYGLNKPSHLREEQMKSPAQPKVSLFEELFPDEAKVARAENPSAERKKRQLPELVLREIEGTDDVDLEDGYVKSHQSRDGTTEAASRDAIKHWNPAILVLEVASPSLTESDFRRIAPKGEHISGWVGPGDIFKVIPARVPTTLKQKTLYFLVFPNPAYARAYQSHVRRLHNLAQIYTPTSLESPMAPPKGMIVQGENIHDLLQDYTLLPPSQKMSLIALFPPFSAGTQRLIDRRGYPELTTPKDKAGRCVLFWVEGYVPTMSQVREFIQRDSLARGLAWTLLEGKNSIQQLETNANLDSEADGEDRMRMGRQLADSETKEQGFFAYLPRTLRRWTIAFQDENEARRFVRRWHMRPFSGMFTEREHKGDVKPLVHAEFMW